MARLGSPHRPRPRSGTLRRAGRLLLCAAAAAAPAAAPPRADAAQGSGIPGERGPVAPPAPALTGAGDALQLQLDRILRASVGERATVGAEVRSLTRGDVLYSLNAERLVQPASTVKLFTSATALHYLGPRFTFRTTLYGTGPVDGDGVLRGDLVLEGRGDPSLSGRFYADSVTYVFDGFVQALRDRGVVRVDGDLVGDNRYFEGPELGEGWAWDAQQWWYAAQVDALSFNDNVVTVRVEPGAGPGSPARVEVVPETDYVTVENDVVTKAGRGGQSITVHRQPESNEIQLRGRVPRRGGAALVIAVDDPARFALTVLHERLADAGIEVDGEIRLAGEEDAAGVAGRTPLVSHFSPPLAELLKVVNKRSQNLHAEQVLRALGAETRGRGSAGAGIAAIDDFLRGEVGVAPGAVFLVDGSGLSRLNLVTPHAVVQLLSHMARHPHAREFYESLFVPGEDARARRLDEPLTRGNLHAKTGTVRYVSALSGYVDARNGERLAFAIVLNNRPEGKASSVELEDDVVRALARFTR
jgi:D-alanyl-D-alanine carboxypeptidase/D-alanyl-D-alanine-endopeptidase (penicillin-binding protein 4)